MFYNLIALCTLFLIYAFIGWCVEVGLALFNNHKFINRGFLIGPIVPIWGAGAILITLILKPTDTVFSLIVSSAFIGTFLEYVVNYAMEKIFKARWWDYSNLPFNINGRVCLSSSIFFGIGGLGVVKYFNPFFLNIIESFDKTLLCIIISILMVIFVIDFCISCNIVKKIKLSAELVRKDYTDEITKKVKEVLSEKSLAFKRLLKAFPNVSFIKK